MNYKSILQLVTCSNVARSNVYTRRLGKACEQDKQGA